MNKALWELTINDSQTEWVDTLPLMDPNSVRLRIYLKNAALRKLQTLSLISAEFDHDPSVFEPWINVVIDEGSALKCFGAYSRAYREENPMQRPTLCLRKGSWDRSKDHEQFYLAEDKGVYLERDQPVTATVLYTSLEKQPEVLALIDEVTNGYLNGIKWNRQQNPQKGVQKIYFDLWHYSDNYSFEYSPITKSNRWFEAWIEKWINAFDAVDFGNGYFPDGASRVSYRMSLLEWMDYFRGYRSDERK